MWNNILFAIGLSMIPLAVVLGMLFKITDFLDYLSRKDDPEWWVNYDKHYIELTREMAKLNKWENS